MTEKDFQKTDLITKISEG